MKITIELPAEVVAGLKEYLKSVSHYANPKITKKDIEEEIKGYVWGCLQTGAVADYITINS